MWTKGFPSFICGHTTFLKSKDSVVCVNTVFPSSLTYFDLIVVLFALTQWSIALADNSPQAKILSETTLNTIIHRVDRMSGLLVFRWQCGAFWGVLSCPVIARLSTESGGLAASLRMLFAWWHFLTQSDLVIMQNQWNLTCLHLYLHWKKLNFYWNANINFSSFNSPSTTLETFEREAAKEVWTGERGRAGKAFH